MIKLNADETTVLKILMARTMPYGEMCASFAGLSNPDSPLDRPRIRRACRSLARKGLAEYHRGLWTEDGEMAGAGYCITSAGQKAIVGRGEW